MITTAHDADAQSLDVRARVRFHLGEGEESVSDDEDAFSGGFCVSLLEKISLVKGRVGGRGSKREKMMWERLWWELREGEE